MLDPYDVLEREMLAKAENIWHLPPRTPSAFNPVFDIAYGSMEAKKHMADRGRGVERRWRFAWDVFERIGFLLSS